jgi:hypothetical protein
MRSTRLAAITVFAAACLVASLHGATTSRPQADSFAKKIAVIKQHAERTPTASRRTTVTEGEVNSWFVYRAQPLLPVGVKDPKVVAVGNGKLAGTIVVDLEDIGKKQSSGGTLDAWKYLGGRVPVAVTGVLTTGDGKGRFTVEGAELAGIPLPRRILQELVSYYTRSEDHPNGVRLDEPFSLPANIKQIQVGQGQAVVVQ